MRKNKNDFLPTELPKLGVPGYLGNTRIVGDLLRRFAADVIDTKFEAHELTGEIDKLAAIFLGQDPEYPGPNWNSPGQIDAYLASTLNIHETEPRKIVGTAITVMLNELFTLQEEVEQKQLIKEQWIPMANEILLGYTNLFLGLPREFGF